MTTFFSTSTDVSARYADVTAAGPQPPVTDTHPDDWGPLRNETCDDCAAVAWGEADECPVHGGKAVAA